MVLPYDGIVDRQPLDSRLRGNDGRAGRESRRYCLMMVLSTGNPQIPAYAGMTVERRRE